MIYSHKCPCGENYTDDDPDLYLCPSCIEKRQAIAKKIDAKFSTVGIARPMTPLDEYDQSVKVNGLMYVKL